MTRFFLLLWRLFALTLSYLLSTFVAAGFLTFALFLGADPSWLNEDVEVAVWSMGFLGFMWLAITQLTFAPALLAFIVLEFGRMETLLANVLAGGFCALVALVLSPAADEVSSLPYPERDVWIAVLAAGFVGGLTHWILAGCRAGRWMGPQTQKQD